MMHLDATAASFLAALGIASIKAAAIVAAALLATIAMRRRSAALKHLIWTAALAATVAMLVLPAVLPAWRVVPLPAVSLEVATTPSDAHRLPSSRSVLNEDVDGAGSNGVSQSSRVAAATRISPTTIAGVIADHWPLAACAIWLISAIAVLARSVRSTVALHWLTRRTRALDGRDGERARSLASRLRLKRTVTFHLSDEVELPFTWGIVRPRVLLPDDASEWRASRLTYVLQHELAHVQRMDAATQLIATAASALFWFHPLVRLAAGQMRRERERACDDDVLAQGAVASDYAGELLALVRTHSRIDRHIAALAMARRSQFEGRLLALLDPALERTAVSIRQVVATLALAMPIVVPVATLRGTDAAPSSAKPTIAATPPAPMSLVAPAISAPSAPILTSRHRRPQSTHPADLFDGCLTDGSSYAHRHQVNGQTLWTAGAQDEVCSYQLTAHGDLTFNDDVTAIADIPADGDIDITTNVRGAVTHLLARRSAAGGVVYDFTTNGTAADYITAGRPWLAAFLTALDRQTAFAIDRRLPLLLRNGGATLVLDEIDCMHADHAKMLYLIGLSTATTLDAASISRLIVATGSMRTDHPKVEALIALAKSQNLSNDNRRAYVALASTLEADHDRRRVLAATSHF